MNVLLQLAVIPGYHLYRDPFKWNTSADDDESMAAYIQDMKHPAGKPLAIHHRAATRQHGLHTSSHASLRCASPAWHHALGIYSHTDNGSAKRFASISRSVPDEGLRELRGGGALFAGTS